MATRPTTHWRETIATEAAEVAAGTTDVAILPDLFPEALLNDTDAVLAAFEVEVAALTQPTDEAVLATVQHVVLALNGVNEAHDESAYETDERERLCLYIDEVLTEHGIDVAALAERRGLTRYEITDEWRDW
ncbi:hypothetical protein [Actinokineospora sp. NBRC 105648]|uniref:hypothetical protein n=1 Tax=Actinokineospora sp. NBRC 105648 TaxID=3032206 RepID=UPI00255459E6|nr:hypothetical protein [Actinokineospora sp. NBRC 105648]